MPTPTSTSTARRKARAGPRSGGLTALLLLGSCLALVPAMAWAQGADGPEVMSPGYWVEDEKGKCIDGSPPVYYLRPGTGEGATKWLIYYEGGGWCANAQECYDRTLTELGSSENYDKAKPLEWDMLTSRASKNPLIHNWNVVFVKYCDGGFFTSDRLDTEVYQGKTLYFRGKYIQEAILKHLTAHHGLDRGTELIFGGCSAGAMGALLQVDHWAASEVLPPSIRKVTAVPDSGFLLPYQGPGKCANYEARMIEFYNKMSVEWAVPPACLEKHKKDKWRCFFFAENSIPYVKTPLFVLQSKFDKWQREALFCGKPGDVAGHNHFGHVFEQRFWAVVGRNAKDGYLLDSCTRHCGSWGLVESTDGLTQEAAFRRWYTALPADMRVKPEDTPLTVGTRVLTALTAQGLLPADTLPAPAAPAATEEPQPQPQPQQPTVHHAVPATTILPLPKEQVTVDKRTRRRRRRRQGKQPPQPQPLQQQKEKQDEDDEEDEDGKAMLSVPVETATAILSLFRHNNTGLFPCEACCHNGQGDVVSQSGPAPRRSMLATLGGAWWLRADQEEEEEIEEVEEEKQSAFITEEEEEMEEFAAIADDEEEMEVAPPVMMEVEVDAYGNVIPLTPKRLRSNWERGWMI